jgi:alpha-1,3-rhamnosyl/mannosyltransferase
LGDAALVLPGFDADAWAHALDRLFSDPSRLDALRAAGPARAALYRWERTARETLEVYRAVAR